MARIRVYWFCTSVVIKSKLTRLELWAHGHPTPPLWNAQKLINDQLWVLDWKGSTLQVCAIDVFTAIFPCALFVWIHVACTKCTGQTCAPFFETAPVKREKECFVFVMMIAMIEGSLNLVWYKRGKKSGKIFETKKNEKLDEKLTNDVNMFFIIKKFHTNLNPSRNRSYKSLRCFLPAVIDWNYTCRHFTTPGPEAISQECLKHWFYQVEPFIHICSLSTFIWACQHFKHIFNLFTFTVVTVFSNDTYVDLRNCLMSWGRCYDHNFLRFLQIIGEKIGIFLKNQGYGQFFYKK
jgi:hypothetical protein